MDFAIVKTPYYEGLETELERYFASLTTSLFNDNIWVFEKMRKSAGHSPHSIKIYFSDANQSIFKYYAISALKNGNSVSTVSNKITGLSVFVKFLRDNYPDTTLQKVNRYLVAEYKRFVSKQVQSKATRESYWTALTNFFYDMLGWAELPAKPPLVRNNPFSRTGADRKHDEKYVSEYVLQQYDLKFKDTKMPLHKRLIYWIARSIPSRITEVTGMNLDCLKPYKDKWILLMPTWKQNGGYLEAQIRRIYIAYEGHGKFLIDMIREQQKISHNLQHLLTEEKKGMLFTYARISRVKRKGKMVYVPYANKVIIANGQIIGKWFRDFAQWKIKDEDGNDYVITTHQLRHNGITDRVWAGFNVVQIRDMTGHQGNAMIETAYSHIIPQEMIKMQRKIIDNREGQSSTPRESVLFRGRILNMDEQTESRLLKNVRAQRIGKIGICSDIIGCKNNPFECLDCNDFIPNADELDYFENQVLEWTEKVAKFFNHEYMRQNADYNLSLNQNIVAKIKRVINGGNLHAKNNT